MTTAGQLSLSSGRGMGLAAVMEVCLELGGQATLLDNDEGQGTLLQVDLPDHAMAVAS